MLYQAYQFQSDLMSPLRLMAQSGSSTLSTQLARGSLAVDFHAILTPVFHPILTPPVGV